ncbi:uncharacterized protein LOC123527583 [Mercenaria mercenaria]|uniref:uncharacterized protein LOC123527583 n=1 Tax=Mercenaria mercenaria TaxID=6596 RepID=UPI00234E5D84|nr:uncharacterized protein LOC123527583 [Mercenaria mercenaria]
MSAGWKFINNIKSLKSSAKLLSAAAVTATATSLSKSKRKLDGKDEILFMSKEDNAVPSTAKIVMQEIGENRDPVLSNGDLNWACACIERDVIGPCNVEFRNLREFMHVQNIKDDIEAFDAEMKEKFDRLFEDFIICTMDHPVYYEDSMLDEEREEIKKKEEKEKELEERKRKEKEANRRHFGKDEVVFITKEENSKPSTVMIPKVQVEENRGPVLPNGEINWACTCIEKDVVGPCNIEFREFRAFVAAHRNVKDDTEIPEKGRTIIGNFIGCVRNNPVYYSSLLSKDQDDDEENDIDEDNDFDQMSGTKTER